MKSNSSGPRASRNARSAVVFAALMCTGWVASGCVQNPVAPSLSLGTTQNPAPGRQMPASGPGLRVAPTERAERMRFDGDRAYENLRIAEDERAERLRIAEDERAERMRFDGDRAYENLRIAEDERAER